MYYHVVAKHVGRIVLSYMKVGSELNYKINCNASF